MFLFLMFLLVDKAARIADAQATDAEKPQTFWLKVHRSIKRYMVVKTLASLVGASERERILASDTRARAQSFYGNISMTPLHEVLTLGPASVRMVCQMCMTLTSPKSSIVYPACFRCACANAATKGIARSPSINV